MTAKRALAFLTSLAALLFALFAVPVAAASAKPADEAQVAWQLLDYIAVDYEGAVRAGRVISPGEYAEMREFAATVGRKLDALPASPGTAKLVEDQNALSAAIGRKASSEEVRKIARAMGSALLAEYPVTLSPAVPPNPDRGAELFAAHCASCHGVRGDADTSIAAQLDPPPVDFTDRQRADQRSPFALYQVISQGLEGTAMASFSALPEADRWALAFHSSRFAYPKTLAAEGKRIWNADPALRARISGLPALSGLTGAALQADIGAERATAVLAYLRSNPGAVETSATALALARTRLAESVSAYRSGNRDRAQALALSAYLDGFEPVEASLRSRDSALMGRVERAMGELRFAIDRGASANEVAQRAQALEDMFVQVEAALGPDRGSALSTFVGALTVLLREGLEALLIVIAMLAFLRKGGRSEMTRPVHFGWIAALAAGVLTWLAATQLVTISGATRELTEGFGSLLASAILLFVGIWMHGKAQAGEWQRYLRDKLGDAVSTGSAWFLFSLAFIAVYREIFETILFFTALAAAGHFAALLGGAFAGAVVLSGIAVAMLRFSRRLPVAKFFAYSAALVAVLTVVLAGKGIAALQEAGLVAVTPLALPKIDWIGVFPTLQGVATQLTLLALLAAGFAWNRVRFAPSSEAAA